MSEFTVSGAYVLASCRYPYRSDVVVPRDDSPNRARDKGSSVHGMIANYINSGAVPEDGGPTFDCARAWIDANKKASWVAEPAYAWDPATDAARLLGVDINREYEARGKLPHEVGGSLDVASIEGDTVYVYEFGTGFDIEHKLAQLRLQCLVAARAHRVSMAVGQLVRFRDEGAYPGIPVTFGEFELAAIAGEFAEYLAEVPGSEPTPGEHCKRCNVAPICPVGRALIEQILPASALVKHQWGLEIQSADHAAWLLEQTRLIVAAADQVKNAVRAYVPEGGIKLSDGSMLIEGVRHVPRFDKGKALTLARGLGATEEQIDRCSYMASESSGVRVQKAPKAKVRKPRAA